MLEGKELQDFIIKTTDEAVTVNSSLDNWAKSIGINLYPNQLEILDTILNPSIRNIVVLASRAGGKTFVISVACIKLCLENRKYRVLLLAPKADQSTRILEDGVKPLCLGNDVLKAEVSWDECTKKEFHFKNGSWIKCLSANENTQVEGYHCLKYDSLINMADGTVKPIMDINVGDKVLSYNIYKGEIETGIVKDTYVYLTDDIYEVSFKVGDTIKTVECTSNHVFPTKNRGNVMAKDLTPNDIIVGI